MVTAYNQAGVSYNEIGLPYDGESPVPPFVMPMQSAGGFGLGCAESYDVFIAERGGRRLLMSVPWSSLEWARALDETSEANVQVDGVAGDAYTACCEGLANIDPWAHELCIYRNGVRVWAGPLTSILYTDEGITLPAKDLSAWLDRRRIHDTHNDEDEPTLQVVESYIADALSVDNGMGLTTYAFDDPTGSTITRKVKARENKMCLSELGEIADTDLDWTCIDRMMFLAIDEIPAARFTTLIDSHFRTLADLTVDGDNMVTDMTVTGEGTGDKGPAIQGTAVADTEVSDYYGVHERVISEDGIKTNHRANKRARTQLDLLGLPAARFTGGELDVEFPLTVDLLVPGTTVAVGLTQQCRPVTGTYRFVSFDAQVDADGESISATMEPVGTEG